MPSSRLAQNIGCDLTILCPNCHSLTPNYCGKNMKRRIKPAAQKTR